MAHHWSCTIGEKMPTVVIGKELAAMRLQVELLESIFPLKELWNWEIWYLNATLFFSFQELNYLELSGNNILGCIENEDFERLSKLNNLEILDLSYNKFNNSILTSLSALSSLKSLDISSNRLKGSINAEGK
ncbi:unnamed protein product [Dovyalis caffra]|uniref:Toll-like receptor 3 n=1 Tax=Dovyalis caffra TaxID=77055 RepID=A0AAV1RR81_9ROSI|nr:unnamed protein product [Dovyalis caffra]